MNPNSFDELFGNGGVRIAVIGVLAMLSLFLLAETVGLVQNFGQVDTSTIATITVTGTGKASAAPTIATIDFTVQENADTVAAAQDVATTRTNTALAALKALGIADADVQTSGYNASPQYETPTCPPGVFCPASTGKIVGYQVSQSVTVTVRDTAKVGDVLQKLGSLGVQNISGPNFAVDDTTAVDSEARGKAIADAKQKAQTLAAQLGVHLGPVVGFSENGGVMPVYGLAKEASALSAPAAAPTLPPGQNETDVSVTVVYEIR